MNEHERGTSVLPVDDADELSRQESRAAEPQAPHGLPEADGRADSSEGQAVALAEHLLGLPGGGGWALWRTAGLRSAGFPARGVLALASQECADAADALLDAEEEASKLRSAALAAVSEAFKEADEGEQEQRRVLRKVLRRLSGARHVPDAEAEACPREVAAALSAWNEAHAAAERASAELPARFAEGAGRVSEALREMASDPRFREALVWQNRHAFETAVERLTRESGESGKRGVKERQREELVASYAQRYFVKNDTVGFFGPVGWARLDPDSPEPLSVRPGPSLLSSLGVYFEGWCVDALASTLAKDPAMRPWLVPRRTPFVALEGGTLLLPGGVRVPVSPLQAAALEACDGMRNVSEIAEALTAAGLAQSRAEASEVLAGFERRGALKLGFVLPLEVSPERRLRVWLEKIEDADMRGRALAALDEFERWRERAEQARGDHAAVAEALCGLDAAFERATGESAKREGGKTYAARTLLYCDGRRDVEAAVGREVLEELGGPLGLLLGSGRWLTAQVARRYSLAFRHAHSLLSAKSGSSAVEFINFWMSVDRLVLNDKARVIEGVTAELQERWAKILSVPEGARRVHYTSEELRPRVEAEFGGVGPGWRLARYHSPDVMIVAESAEAVARGDFKLVLGELHLSTLTLRAALFVHQHPRPEELFRAIDSDFPEPRLVPALPKSWSTTRTTLALVSTKDYRLEFAPDSLSGAAAGRTLRIADLVVEDSERGLQVRTRDGSLSFDIMEFLGEVLSSQLINQLKVLGPARHTPRVEIDRVVVARESWRLGAAELSFASLPAEHERFAGARRVARRLGVPRHAFVKSPAEAKPFFVDFESPALVGLLCRAARGLPEGGELAVSEMLPGVGELWLEDAAGERYTSELRLVALDLVS